MSQGESLMTQRDGEARAWGWVAHLRDGGTTPWSAWGSAAGADEQSGRYLPGAQQLELLRRLNQHRLPPPELAERVLATSAPGRGRPDLGLVGVLPESGFGPPPVDPVDLPAEELVRVATALIAEDTVAAKDPLEPRTPRLLRRRYRALGDPELAFPLRDALLADGRPPGGRRATVVVGGTDVASMLVHVWTARCLGAGVRSWPDWLAGEARRPALLERIDLAALARTWAERAGPARVHVVLDDPRRVARLVAGRRRRAVTPRPLSADAVELARRTASVVGTLVTPERRTALMWHRLRPVLAAHPGPELRIGERHQSWLHDRTQRLRRDLAAGDYAVHGTLAEPVVRGSGHGPDDDRVLELAIRVLLGPSIGTSLAERSEPS
ncbi:MAG: hypothetical protein QM747_22055 [Nocardioides sp.]